MLIKLYVYKATLKYDLITVGLDKVNLLHTEMARVDTLAGIQELADKLLEKYQDHDRIIVVSNAMNGDRKIKGFDAYARSLRAKFFPATVNVPASAPRD